MFTRWGDFDRTFGAMDELRRRMDRLWDEYDDRSYSDQDLAVRGGFPRLNVFDAGANLIVQAEVPGLGEKELRLTVNQDVVTIAGERRADVPEGFTVHRQERAPIRFSRSFTLPTKIDAERTSASLKDGILTLTLAKAPEAQPRQITVRAQ